MDMPRLTRKEMAVIRSVMKNPEHTDLERANSMDMNAFTFNKIKNKLIRDRTLRREYVPNYGLLGFEILASSFGSRLDPFFSDGSKRYLESNILERAPTHIVFFLSEPGQGLGFHIIEDFSSMKGGLQKGERMLFELLGAHIGEMSMVPFSLKDVKVESMFDLLRLVEASFDGGIEVPFLEPRDNAQEASSLTWMEFFEKGSHGEDTDITENEMHVLLRMVSDPEGRTMADLSRYRLNRIRDRLLERRLVKPLVIPDPIRIGFRVLSFCHMRLRPGADLDDIKGGSKDIPPNMVLTLHDSQDAIGIGLYPDLDGSSRAVNRLMDVIGGQNVLDGPVHFQVFSLASSADRWPLTFANPLVQKGKWTIPEELFDIVKGITSRGP
ncbi:MAG: hypothetical protein QCI82_10050 [Candidatus Thermoplasmatota archaeon]|nr:hypothetical protein [Candidatus Thermoplasmatota archaeon]